MKKYELELTEEQLRVLSIACEFYARVRMGQFNEIVWRCLDLSLGMDDYCGRRDRAEELLLDARKEIYPGLHGIGHSYGIGKFEDADLAFDIYQVARREFGDKREPFSYNELPKLKEKE